jgi:predicted flap endonuclease-1-like 5' DNA nuclease
MSTPLVLVALAVALIAGFLLGRLRRSGGRADGAGSAATTAAAATATTAAVDAAPVVAVAMPAAAPATAPASHDATAPASPGANGTAGPDAVRTGGDAVRTGVDAEKARLLCALEAETAALRRTLAARDAAVGQLGELDADRRRTYDDLARARAETARYRQLVVDLENNALPPLLDGPGAPDDLKLIVGVGPVLERMLHQLGVMTYRQIARWSERDIDEFDARLPEFPGRIRRDAWVTQARALHQSKFGEVLPARERH